MKYYLIAGEASGDLHASHLMAALKEADPQAEFRYVGGDFMATQGGMQIAHYKEVAYMGFIPVLLHLRAIWNHLKQCKEDIATWKPDVVIPVDYPGFNLRIARFVKEQRFCPVYYYIPPKIWAWKEHRIHQIRSYVDEVFSILPFEQTFYTDKHRYPIRYVGNPTQDEVKQFQAKYPIDCESFQKEHHLTGKPIIALLAGSRKQEIKDNLPMMLKAASAFPHCELVLAGSPGLCEADYRPFIQGESVNLIFGQTYRIVQHAHVALVTSGTATLETALLGTPQAVCYATPLPRLVAWLRKRFLKVKYISLVNLVADSEVVRELVADTMTTENVRKELDRLINNEKYRQKMLDGYKEVEHRLGTTGAPKRAAQQIVELLRKRH